MSAVGRAGATIRSAYTAGCPAVGSSSAWEMPASRAAHRPPSSGLEWLQTRGGRIVDEVGRTVLLRGFNSDALLEDGVRHATLDEEDATLIQRSGFDVVRLPLAWSRLEPRRGTIDQGYLDRVAAAVAMLERHDLHVVLEMHFLDWG